MRLLNTLTFDFQEFDHRGEQMPPYAILSHVWSQREQTYAEIKEIASSKNQRRWWKRGNDREQGISQKLVEFCKVSASLGYDWCWADTCCINKESSAELSEAINSMFEWYSKSSVCITYLHDVDGFPYRDGNPTTNAEFRASKWFTRGWTLQELIAPAAVLFANKTWHIIGSKVTLARPLASITDIGVEFLINPGAFTTASVFRRFFWARKRQTTRVEDRAYSLLGIFGVNMPTIYGEGEKAFMRLQEEILKVSSDQTLFAWGLTRQFALFKSAPGLLAPDPTVFEAYKPGTSRSPPTCPEPLPIEELPRAVKTFAVALYRSRESGFLTLRLASDLSVSVPSVIATQHKRN